MNYESKRPIETNDQTMMDIDDDLALQLSSMCNISSRSSSLTRRDRPVGHLTLQVHQGSQQPPQVKTETETKTQPTYQSAFPALEPPSPVQHNAPSSQPLALPAPQPSPHPQPHPQTPIWNWNYVPSVSNDERACNYVMGINHVRDCLSHLLNMSNQPERFGMTPTPSRQPPINPTTNGLARLERTLAKRSSKWRSEVMDTVLKVKNLFDGHQTLIDLASRKRDYTIALQQNQHNGPQIEVLESDEEDGESNDDEVEIIGYNPGRPRPSNLRQHPPMRI